MTLSDIEAILLELGTRLRMGEPVAAADYYEISILRDRWRVNPTAENWALVESRAREAGYGG